MELISIFFSKNRKIFIGGGIEICSNFPSNNREIFIRAGRGGKGAHFNTFFDKFS